MPLIAKRIRKLIPKMDESSQEKKDQNEEKINKT